jgi:quercetin dioxygenase-like cupin family protein
MRTSVLLLICSLVAIPAFAQAPAQAVQWGPAPPFLAAGARFAVLQGDPSKAGVYTIRLELPDGYVIKPHFHPTDEHITVISGVFLVGMGDSVDLNAGMPVAAGGFVTAPAQAHHSAAARGVTVVQVHGDGPFVITYVKPADDPRTPKPAKR